LNRTRCPYAHTSAEQRLSEFVDQRRDFVEQLKKTLIAEIYRQDSMSKGERSELCYCLTVIIDSQLLCDVITELQGDVEQRDHAYNTCSRALVDASDPLIVIYDQRDYTNRGTAYTAHYAAERGIPLIHVPNRSGLTHMACNDEYGNRKIFEYTTLRLQALLHNLRYGLIDE
jgi:hypothetical protein